MISNRVEIISSLEESFHRGIHFEATDWILNNKKNNNNNNDEHADFPTDLDDDRVDMIVDQPDLSFTSNKFYICFVFHVNTFILRSLNSCYLFSSLFTFNYLLQINQNERNRNDVVVILHRNLNWHALSYSQPGERKKKRRKKRRRRKKNERCVELRFILTFEDKWEGFFH